MKGEQHYINEGMNKNKCMALHRTRIHIQRLPLTIYYLPNATKSLKKRTNCD